MQEGGYKGEGQSSSDPPHLESEPGSTARHDGCAAPPDIELAPAGDPVLPPAIPALPRAASGGAGGVSAEVRFAPCLSDAHTTLDFADGSAAAGRESPDLIENARSLEDQLPVTEVPKAPPPFGADRTSGPAITDDSRNGAADELHDTTEASEAAAGYAVDGIQAAEDVPASKPAEDPPEPAVTDKATVDIFEDTPAAQDAEEPPEAGAGEAPSDESRWAPNSPANGTAHASPVVEPALELASLPAQHDVFAGTTPRETLGTASGWPAYRDVMPPPPSRSEVERQPGPAEALPSLGDIIAALWVILRIALKGAVIVLFALAVFILSLMVLYRWVDPPASTLILAQRLEGAPISQRWVSLERISPYLRRAVIMSEDGRFCYHHGVDWGEMAEALESARDGLPRGGSTISMQVVKNLFLWPSKSYVRKAIEIPLAYGIEALWSKQRILEIYLNIAEWGPGIFGAEAAARYHFRKPASLLTLREAALLAVSLPNPFERIAGAPGPGTQRLAERLSLRMRASSRNAACVLRPAPQVRAPAYIR